MPSSQAYKSSLVTFGRHTPRTLRQQLLCQLALQYVGIKEGHDILPTQPEDPRPSICRFHGALLFVDISGFTALSLRLKVEDLKNHINEYFATMLSIVDRWDGDVIKFAGDALYVVWKTDLSMIQNEDEDGIPSRLNKSYSRDFLDSKYGQTAILSCLKKATACGLEIGKTCCNHEVLLDPPAVEVSPASSGIISKILPKWARLPANNNGKVTPEVDNVAYLNVHAGVSFGLMAGVDIGALDRWEYFLIGKPLHRVAEAEEEAAKGDIVICPEGHALLHPAEDESVAETVNTSSKLSSTLFAKGTSTHVKTNVELPCGCIRTPKGFYKITKVDIGSPHHKPQGLKLKRARSKTRLDEPANNQHGENAQNYRIYDDCCVEIEKLYSMLQSILKTEVQAFLNRSDMLARAQQKLTNGNVDSATGGVLAATPKSKERIILDIMSNDLRKQVFDWLQYCVLEDIVKHVHDVARDDYFYEPKPRATAFKTFLENLLKGGVNKPNVRASVIKNPNHDDNDDDTDTSPAPAPPKMMKNKNPSLNGNQFTALVKKASSKYLVQDSVLTAEIRNVMVMFIKIVGLELEVMIDNSGGEASSTHIPGNIHHAIMSFSRSSFRASAGGSSDGGVRRSGGNLRGSVMGNSRATAKGQSIGGVFDFIDRTANEIAADTLMLSRVQKCMEALCEVFVETGGQMRQFIVDDKGTVCIGTFGLRGSVGVDNAAAALETAKKIVIRLQALNLTASIGITSGKAYCGLVGSPNRHEYAVMGPSTNLSARLMCKAPPFGVICDIETKNRDRTHGFEPLNEVNAKGYAHPVMTFKPIFEDIVQHLRANTDSQVYAALSPLAVGGNGSKRVNVLRSSTDWYIGNLAKSQSRNFRGSFESAHGGHLVVNLSGKGSTRGKIQKSPSNSALFQRRRGSVIVGTDKDEALKQGTRKHKLHGRQDELRQILTFLFPNASASFMSQQDSVGSLTTGGALSAGSSVMGINTGSGSNGVVELDAMAESRMVAISGGEGTGKSALADSVAHQIFVASKHNPLFRIFTFRNRPSSLEMHIPFHGVKPILQDMLAKIASLPSHSKTPRAGGRPQGQANLVKESSVRKLKLSLKDTIFTGLSMVFASLPSEMLDLRCLLSLASIIPAEEGVDLTVGEAMDEEKRTQATVDLIVAMMGLFPVITKSSVLLLIEEMQSLDYPSRLILQRIFKDSRGIFILATHRASPAAFNAEGTDGLNTTLTEFDLTNVHAFTGTITPATPSNHANSILETYVSSSNFKLIDLLPLSAEATRSLIVDTLPDTLLYKVNDAFIEKIVEASGGHPMYAYELTRSVAEKLKDTSTEKDLSTIITEMEVGVTSNRIEEMICYRFDQLDTSVQMVLKVAAVACSHGAPFTLDMLIYALIGGEGEGDFDDFSGTGSDGESGSGRGGMGGGFASPGGAPVTTYDMSSESAREVLETIIVRGEFIQICQVSDEYDEGSDLEKSGGLLPTAINVGGDLLTPHTLLEFKIVLEQITIYNLLVDDQREVYHERVAAYYHQKLSTLNDSATYSQVLYLATLIEEAYHWQQGACYISAMKANYDLAQEYREMKDSHACNMALQTAYSMFMSLKGEHNVPAYVLCTRKELRNAFEQSDSEYVGPQVIGGDTRGDDGSKASESLAGIWTLETLYSMFNGEINDLRIAISIHQQLVLHELTSFENPKYILPVAEEAIKIMCAVRKPHILANSAVFSSLMAINASHSKNGDKSFKSGGSMRGFTSAKKGANAFFLEDFESFAPPLYFSYALAACMIESAHMPHDPLFHSSSHRGKGKITLDELMKILSVSSMSDKRYFVAQTQCLLLMAQLNSQKMSVEKVEQLLSSLLTNYFPLPVNMVEAEAYLGIDIAGLTLAFVGQFFILRGFIAKGRKHLVHAIDAVRLMTLPSSAAFAIPPLIASLHLIKDYELAFSLLDDYDNLFGIPHVYQPNTSMTSLFSEKSSLHRRLTRSISIASSIQAAEQLPTVGLRPHFIQKLRVWLMCDRNQNGRYLDLAERILGFSQLTSRMQQQVMKDIISPQALDGNFWPEFLLFCGLSLSAITAMVFSCHTVMLHGSKLFTNDTLHEALVEYAKQSAQEHHIETGSASITAKLYFHQANIKLTSVVKALGVNVKNILVPATLDEQLLKSIQVHIDAQFPFAAALLSGLALQVTINKDLRRSVSNLQKAALQNILEVQEKGEDNNEHDKGLDVKEGKQLWLQRRRLV